MDVGMELTCEMRDVVNTTYVMNIVRQGLRPGAVLQPMKWLDLLINSAKFNTVNSGRGDCGLL
jgi:hypothetical protein